MLNIIKELLLKIIDSIDAGNSNIYKDKNSLILIFYFYIK